MGTPHRSPLSAHKLFRCGHDTESIAAILNISEPEALKQLSRERSARLGRADPYEKSSPAVREANQGRQALVAYAGRE